MALLSLSNALSASIQRSVAVSELRHEEKIKEVRYELASKALLREDTFSRKLTEARENHAKWLTEGDETRKQLFEGAKADLKAYLASPEA